MIKDPPLRILIVDDDEQIRSLLTRYLTQEGFAVAGVEDGVAMDEWLARKGLSWDGVESTFYSDSFNDVPLLERVDHPVATNPDARLRELAGQRGWRVLDLFGEAS